MQGENHILGTSINNSRAAVLGGGQATRWETKVGDSCSLKIKGKHAENVRFCKKSELMDCRSEYS